MNNFELVFMKWANSCLSQDIPSETKAFSFNLYETGVDFGFELIGGDEFDPEDSDWACAENFVPNPRSIEIPLNYSGEKWEQCLEAMSLLVKKYLASQETGALLLNKNYGVGICFVDGDMSVLLSP